MVSELVSVLSMISLFQFEESRQAIDALIELVRIKKANFSDSEGELTDWFVMVTYLKLLSACGRTWEAIRAQEFSASWNHLQGVLDLLRLVKRFSELNVSFSEDQCLELEQAYPYNVFFSVGMIVEHYECSICGHDIDSNQCPHRRGYLYGGELAYGIARNAVGLDHVSMVTNPVDKRCVLSYSDTSEHFRLLRYISELMVSDKVQALAFARLEWSRRMIPNPAYVSLGRNDKCFCGSGKKFRKCGVGKKELESDYVDVILREAIQPDKVIIR